MHIGECNQLLVVLTVQMLRRPRQPLDSTVDEIRYSCTSCVSTTLRPVHRTAMMSRASSAGYWICGLRRPWHDQAKHGELLSCRYAHLPSLRRYAGRSQPA